MKADILTNYRQVAGGRAIVGPAGPQPGCAFCGEPGSTASASRLQGLASKENDEQFHFLARSSTVHVEPGANATLAKRRGTDDAGRCWVKYRSRKPYHAGQK